MADTAIITYEQMAALSAQQSEQIRQMAQMMVQMAATVQLLRGEVDALKKQQVTVTAKQAKALKARIAARSAAICERYALTDPKDQTPFKAAMKREVLRQYGVDDLHDLPAAYYDMAGVLIDNWTSFALVKKVREKHETGHYS